MQTEKVTANISELQEELAHVKTLGDVFMHYVCSLSLEATLNENYMQQIHHTYLESINTISSSK